MIDSIVVTLLQTNNCGLRFFFKFLVGIGSVDDLKEFLCFYNIGDGVSEEEMHAAFPDHEIITAWFKKERQFKG